MPSKPYASLPSAATLAALLLCALGAPVDMESTDSPAGDFSGEEEVMARPSYLLSASPIWSYIIEATSRHKTEFEDEFQHEVKYDFLDNYRISSIPANCPSSNFSKEACLQRLADGLYTYMALLKHVEREYPNRSVLLEVKLHLGTLIKLIKDKMRDPGQVTVPTSSQEEQLLQDINNPNNFHRKMTAHSILRHFHHFLCRGIVEIRRREKGRKKKGVSNNMIVPVHPYNQLLKR